MMKSGPIFSAATALLWMATGAAAQETDPRDEPTARMPELPPAQFDERLSIGGEEIDARKLRSRMTVDVNVNGQGPYKFVVDSGADTSVIGESLAGKLGLPATTPALLHAITESTVVNRVLVDEIQLGPTFTTELEVPVLDERDIGGDGMIGLDALVGQRLMMDFEKRIITVDEGLNREPVTGDDVIVVTGRLRRGQLILTQVRAQKQKVDAVVDTGSEVTIGNLALRDKLVRRHSDLFQKVKVYGVTGAALEIDFAIIKELKLGSVILQNVPIAFADVPPFEVFGINHKPSLLLGTDLMENFRRVSLDFKARKVRFQLRKCDYAARLRTMYAARVRTVPTASRLRANETSACN